MRLRVRPIWLVLLFACGPQGGTEVGNPTFACAGSDESGDASGGAGGGAPTCVPGAPPTARCDGAPCDLVDFGEVEVGVESRVVVALEHRGCDPISVSPPEIDGGVLVRSGVTAPATLARGETLTFTLAYTPIAPGPAAGDVRFLLTPGGELLLPWTATGR